MRKVQVKYQAQSSIELITVKWADKYSIIDVIIFETEPSEPKFNGLLRVTILNDNDPHVLDES